MNKIKKILIFVTCFCFSFVFLFSINFARSNIVKADYNLFNYNSFYNSLAEINSSNLVSEVKDSRNCLKILSSKPYLDTQIMNGEFLPNVQYIFSFEIYHQASEVQPVGLSFQIKYTDGINSYEETAIGLNVWEEAVFISLENKTIDCIALSYGTGATITYLNIDSMTLLYLDENLGSVYEQGFINGSHSPVSIWQDIALDDELLNSHWYFSELPMYRTSTQFTGGGVRSSVFFNLPIGYYRITQKNLPDYFRQGYPSLHPASKFGGSHVAPLVYTTDDFFYWAVDIVGDYDTDRYVYFSVDSSEKRYSFQLACPIAALFIGNWNDAFTSLSQIITLSVDLAGNDHYRDGYQDGYNSGATSGYIEGETDGLSEGFLNGYGDGYDDGFKDGDNAGYAEGYDYGYNVGASGTITTNWFTSFLSSTFNILNIEIFPNIKLVYLIFIPVGLGVLALILKMARG